MLRFNESKVKKLLSEIALAQEQLKELGGLSEEEFSADKHKVASAKYNFIVAIEGAIDMCNHVIAQNTFRSPDDFADTFRVLGEKGFFEEGFVADLMKMAKFRNRLVHLYWEVDTHELYAIMKTKLSDVQRFLEAFGQGLSREAVGIANRKP